MDKVAARNMFELLPFWNVDRYPRTVKYENPPDWGPHVTTSSSTRALVDGLLLAGVRLNTWRVTHARVVALANTLTCLGAILTGMVVFLLGRLLELLGIQAGVPFQLFGVGCALAGCLPMLRGAFEMARLRVAMSRWRRHTLRYGLAAIGSVGEAPAALLWKVYEESRKVGGTAQASNGHRDLDRRHMEDLVQQQVRDWVLEQLPNPRWRETFASLAEEYDGSAQQLADIARKL